MLNSITCHILRNMVANKVNNSDMSVAIILLGFFKNSKTDQITLMFDEIDNNSMPKVRDSKEENKKILVSTNSKDADIENYQIDEKLDDEEKISKN